MHQIHVGEKSVLWLQVIKAIVWCMVGPAYIISHNLFRILGGDNPHFYSSLYWSKFDVCQDYGQGGDKLQNLHNLHIITDRYVLRLTELSLLIKQNFHFMDKGEIIHRMYRLQQMIKAFVGLHICLYGVLW